MPIVFAAITPHPTLLMPQIGKGAVEKLKKTKDAFKKMEEKLYVSRPDIIVIFTPHGHIYPHTFSVYAHTKFKSHYEHFGDFTTSDTWNGAPNFAAMLSDEAYNKQISIHLESTEKIDHGVSIPLHFLTAHLPQIKVLPISHSGLTAKTHLEFGSSIKNLSMQSQDRIALIASANLSHALTSDSPAGFHKAGKEFDEMIIKLLESHNSAGIAHMDPTFVKNAAEYGYYSILMLLGVIQKMNYTFKNYAYESPFGVGYLTGEFEFH
ncbi:MAG: AmmeMemoRadiSam system protein B [Candidatus Magasanikbacteria bacterium]|nr:AmmeMemoRadiSam system protein B [Candidatus Magasanikbacteria bacterium]